MGVDPDQRRRLTEALGEAQRRGFVGPGPVEPHIEHSLVFAATIEEVVGRSGGRGADLGSGGGLPGLVVACALPAWEWLLLDASLERVDWLAEAVRMLGLSTRTATLHARAEDAGRDPDLRHRFDVVLSRAFGPPAMVAECAAPLLGAGGWLVVSEPPLSPSTGAAPGSRWPDEPLAGLGLRQHSDRGDGLAVLQQATPCPQRFPRSPNAIRRRPLF